MTAVFEDHGIRFQFPENWRLEKDGAGPGATISVTSPNTAFWALTMHDSAVDPEAAADAALETMRDEYETLDSVPVTESFGTWETVGHDVNFLCLDLTNTCWIRAFRTARHTLLVFYQANDTEIETMEPVFRAIGSSIETVEA